MTIPSRVAAELPPIRMHRVLVGTFMLGLVVLGLVTATIIPADYPDPIVPAGLAIMAVAAFAMCEIVGYRVPPVPPGNDPVATGPKVLAAFQTALFLRVALCESVGILALLLAFVQNAWWTFAVGLVYSLFLLWWHCWPSARVVTKAQQHFDAAGGRSELRDLLEGREPGAGTAPMSPT